MKSKYDFLDSAQQHTLTEQECELVTFFRIFTKSQKQATLQMMLGLLLNDKRLDKMLSKKKVVSDI